MAGKDGGGVSNLLRRRRPSSCTAAPSPVRQGHRRRVSEACDTGRLLVGGRCAVCLAREGKDDGRGRFDRGGGVVVLPVRCGAVVGRSIVDRYWGWGARTRRNAGLWFAVTRPFCTWVPRDCSRLRETDGGCVVRSWAILPPSHKKKIAY